MTNTVKKLLSIRGRRRPESVSNWQRENFTIPEDYTLPSQGIDPARPAELDTTQQAASRPNISRHSYHEEQQRQQHEAQLRSDIMQREAAAKQEREREMRRQQIDRERIEQEKYQREQNASSGCVRHLRWLMQEKYRLDIYVWDNRDCLEADREKIKAEYTKADQIWMEINMIVNGWEKELFGAEEWKVAHRIKAGVHAHPDQHITWTEVPPWDRPEGDGI